MKDRLTRTRETEARLAAKRRRWMVRGAFVLAGMTLGYVCSELPASVQFFCHLTAKAFTLLGGP